MKMNVEQQHYSNSKRPVLAALTNGNVQENAGGIRTKNRSASFPVTTVNGNIKSGTSAILKDELTIKIFEKSQLIPPVYQGLLPSSNAKDTTNSPYTRIPLPLPES